MGDGCGGMERRRDREVEEWRGEEMEGCRDGGMESGGIEGWRDGGIGVEIWKDGEMR